MLGGAFYIAARGGEDTPVGQSDRVMRSESAQRRRETRGESLRSALAMRVIFDDAEVNVVASASSMSEDAVCR